MAIPGRPTFFLKGNGEGVDLGEWVIRGGGVEGGETEVLVY